MVLVDTNVLLDVFTDDPHWQPWSAGQLEAAAAEGELAINPIIYAELAPGFERESQLERALARWPLVRLALPYEAGFKAGQAFVAYRREGGQRRSPLPDFYIGAHALVAHLPLLTRDAARYRRHFPRLKLRVPQGA
jgi:predicted nucleic acid-binding protein